ncbi:MAG: AAA domain-containing protein, partial [Desulfobacterales bacterium]|nr:AAA domain-containing protein [Desulfobacterales bacterium]
MEKKEPAPVYKSREVSYGLVGALAIMYAAGFSGWRIRKRHVRVKQEEKEREARENAEKDKRINKQRGELKSMKADAVKKYALFRALESELEKTRADAAGASDLQKELAEKNAEMKDEVEERNRAIDRLEKEKQELNRKLEDHTRDSLATTRVTGVGAGGDAGGSAAAEKPLGLLQLGGALRYDLDACPAIRPLTADTWVEADRLIKKGGVDVVIPWPAMLNDIRKGNTPPLETPILVHSIKPAIRKRFAALFPGALVGFVNPLLKKSDALIGAVRMIAAIEAATLYKDETHRLISRNPIMMGIVKIAEGYARNTAVKNIFLRGETGTGKELVARVIHRRREGPFIVLNCKETSGELLGARLFGSDKGDYTSSVENRKGAIERARRGTLFLDEIGLVETAFLGMLLRVVEEGAYHRLGGKTLLVSKALIVFATGVDISDPGAFPKDLFYRL